MTRTIRFVSAIAMLLVGAFASAAAQSAGNGYLFHAPNATVSVRAGYSRASAASDVFDDVTKDLTLNKGDFSSLTFSGDVAVPITSRLSAVLSAGYSRSNRKSEFRDFVDNNDQPIEQTTTFERIPLTANLRVDLGASGRSIGHLAWIPSKLVPYLGAGIGAMRYRFKQEGDFVDFNTNAVFPSTFVTEDWALVTQGMAGVDYNVSPKLGISFDARYLQARGDLGSSFKGYDKIDLSGLSATVGLSVRL
jgi:opacity protein-like surface antigen